MIQSLKKFTILTNNEAQQSQEVVNILINLSQIVSIKPIKMMLADREVIDGFWIRLTNGKKYKALQIPQELLSSFEESLPIVARSSDDNKHSLSIQ